MVFEHIKHLSLAYVSDRFLDLGVHLVGSTKVAPYVSELLRQLYEPIYQGGKTQSVIVLERTEWTY